MESDLAAPARDLLCVRHDTILLFVGLIACSKLQRNGGR